MGVFSISDAIISLTLVINGVALLSTQSDLGTPTYTLGTQSEETFSLNSRLNSLRVNLRTYSGLISLWNIAVIILIIFIFGD